MFNKKYTHTEESKLMFDQYKLAVEMADNISSRRGTANAFFLTLHSSLIGFYLLVLKEGSIDNKYAIVLPLFGLMIVYIWSSLIKSYRQLNSAKWKVIGNIENYLPSKPFSDGEWMALGEGKDPKLYTPLTETENKIPWMFSGLYILMMVIIFV